MSSDRGWFIPSEDFSRRIAAYIGEIIRERSDDNICDTCEGDICMCEDEVGRLFGTMNSSVDTTACAQITEESIAEACEAVKRNSQSANESDILVWLYGDFSLPPRELKPEASTHHIPDPRTYIPARGRTGFIIPTALLQAGNVGPSGVPIDQFTAAPPAPVPDPGPGPGTPALPPPVDPGLQGVPAGAAPAAPGPIPPAPAAPPPTLPLPLHWADEPTKPDHRTSVVRQTPCYYCARERGHVPECPADE